MTYHSSNGLRSSDYHIIKVFVASKIILPLRPSLGNKIEEVVKKPIKIIKNYNASKTSLTANIKSINPYGLIFVKFSEKMQNFLANNISKIFN